MASPAAWPCHPGTHTASVAVLSHDSCTAMITEMKELVPQLCPYQLREHQQEASPPRGSVSQDCGIRIRTPTTRSPQEKSA